MTGLGKRSKGEGAEWMMREGCGWRIRAALKRRGGSVGVFAVYHQGSAAVRGLRCAVC